MSFNLRVPQNYQSPYTADSLIDHLQSAYATPAACFYAVSGIDGSVVAMTSYSSNITGVPGYPGVTFKRNTGVIASQLQSEGGNAFSQMEATMFLAAAGISEADVTAGKWTHASAVLFVCNYEALNMGQLIMQSGYLAEFSQKFPALVAEIKGLNNALTAQVGTVTWAECLHEFCDARCSLIEADYTVTGTITGVVSQTEFSDSGFALPARWLNNGKLIFTAAPAAATGTLSFTPPAAPLDGDTLTINGAVFTFKDTPTTVYHIQRDTNRVTQAANTATTLNASVDPLVSVATYDSGGTITVTITYDTTGIAGNAFTLAKSGVKPVLSGATLTGGVSGLNHNYILRVDNNNVATTFKLRTPAPYLPVVGDAYRVIAGCSKRLIDCQGRVENDGVTTVNNVVHRAALDFVPTLESFTRLPASFNT